VYDSTSWVGKGAQGSAAGPHLGRCDTWSCRMDAVPQICLCWCVPAFTRAWSGISSSEVNPALKAIKKRIWPIIDLQDTFINVGSHSYAHACALSTQCVSAPKCSACTNYFIANPFNRTWEPRARVEGRQMFHTWGAYGTLYHLNSLSYAKQTINSHMGFLTVFYCWNVQECSLECSLSYERCSYWNIFIYNFYLCISPSVIISVSSSIRNFPDNSLFQHILFKLCEPSMFVIL